MSCEPRLCVAGANPCEHAGKCINTQGSFQCQCLQGYSGPRCEIDVNECLSNPCQNDATCLDQIGEFQCICMPGGWAALRTPAPVLGVGDGRAPGAPELQLGVGLGEEPWEARVHGDSAEKKEPGKDCTVSCSGGGTGGESRAPSALLWTRPLADLAGLDQAKGREIRGRQPRSSLCIRSYYL